MKRLASVLYYVAMFSGWVNLYCANLDGAFLACVGLVLCCAVLVLKQTTK